ncbi:HAMP domain-containing sensor histidine kinase [Pontibacter sp. SGAir0037]|uniref:HAMP domain-containing sensor histidine kinase n=1 Tax=Pontibacter sp. SGAir0037 TaxID=2571030 RepID=UPI0010CD2E1C|nr:HAMP domain-containing sensor histidine kinase [Pontibacter sp. SGAir0037]QCR23142.1 two-component sensor histidine kinase [Pontibacter sp. SGAir0037]
MTIRAKLTLKFAIIIAIILILFSLVVYYFTSLYRQDDFYKRIERRAYIVAHHVLDADELSEQERHRNQVKYYQVLPYEVVKVFDTNGKLLFSDGEGALNINQKLLERVVRQKKVEYEHGTRQVVGIYYPDNQGEFIVFSSCIDAYSLRKLQHLKVILIVGLLGSLVVVIIAGWLFSQQALQPITKVVSEVEKINASGLHMRLSNAEGKDEVSHLAQTFNKMLDRLELAFEMQRTFVSNASHELRTPLTAMIGELEVALMKDRELKEYQRVLSSILEDARLLAELSNGLLQIAQASIDSSKIKQTYLRFDELVWLATDQARKRQPNAAIHIDFLNFPEDEDRLVVKGNEALLLIAIVNVIENAIKFSPSGQSAVGQIIINGRMVQLKVKDKGLGITVEDLKHVFVPFFRADNVRNISGHGIGLPLAERILKLHKGSIHIASQINEGTEVTISLPQAYGFIAI